MTKASSSIAGMVSVDVAIVGGGIVGLTLANALRQADFQVAVIEKAPLPPELDARQPVDLRVSAINHRAVQAMRQWRVWGYCQRRVCAYYDMHVWDATGAGQIHFDSAEAGVAELGYIVENRVLVQALLSPLREAAGVRLLPSTTVQAIQARDTGRSVTVLELDDGTMLAAHLLVGADGARSMVRQWAGIDFQRKSYRQQGLVCTVTTENSHRNTAWQCFMPTGPLAFLPLFNGDSSIVWSLDDAEADGIMRLDDASFMRRLAQASDYRLGEMTQSGPRKCFPLMHGHAAEYVQSGLALVGDAAHQIHPLAGQGANLGIADALCLAQVIGEARQAGRQWYSVQHLRQYQRQRKLDNRLMEDAMTAFKTLFGQRNELLVEIRNAGLNLIDHLPRIKQRFIRQALGS